MADRVNCDLAASTGVHDGEAFIKQLLAGANAVQMVSAIYKHGYSHIIQILEDVNKWMDQEGYSKISDFRGRMSQAKSSNPAAYERVQFLKNFRHFVYQL